ncbi:MAG: acetate--CoA ligase family protein [Patescibacteria group bacterium]
MLSSFFHPSSIAVVGASRDSKKVGYQILKNLLKYQDGKVYPINPSAHTILGLPVFPNLAAFPQKVELAIVAVPAPFVEQVIDDCIEKQVKAVVIITAGFAEMSAAGKQLQIKIATKLTEHHIALLGPNSLGFLYPTNSLNASFASQQIGTGSLALISQSGAMLTALFTEMESNKVGCSFAISLGNKAGISENEALEFAAQDPNTKVIGAYLESFADLSQFFQLASQVAKTKPLIVLKGGRSKTGQAASVSHTAALATNDVLLKAASEQFGFVMVDTVEEFIQTIFFLEQNKTVPENTMIITNAGGPGVNTVDVSEVRQLTLAQWSPSSVNNLQEQLPNSNITNPLDVIGDANAERFSFAIRQAQRDPQIDSIVVIITQQAVTNVPEVVEMLLKIKSKKPLCVALMGGDKFNSNRKSLRAAGIFCTEYPNDIVAMLAITKKAAEAKYFPEKFQPFRLQHDFPISHLATDLNATFLLLAEYGFKLPIYSIIANEKQLDQVHLPSYAKTANLALAHKKDMGAIFGITKTKEDVTNSFAQLKKFGETVLYQQIIEADVELLLGANRDVQFGPYLAIGLGGSWTNILSDRSYTFLPSTRRVFTQKLQQTKAYAALQKLDKKYSQKIGEKVITLMLQVQKLMLAHPEIQELEINPLMINEKGIWAADVKIKTT